MQPGLRPPTLCAWTISYTMVVVVVRTVRRLLSSLVVGTSFPSGSFSLMDSLDTNELRKLLEGAFPR